MPPYDPFAPAPPVQIQQSQSPEQEAALSSQWTQWFQKPENRAALMQFGTALTQPLGLGDTPLAQFSRATSGGVEAKTRTLQAQEEQRQKQLEEERAAQELAIKQQRANAYGQSVNQYGAGLTANQQLMQQNRIEKAFMAFVKSKYELDPTVDIGAVLGDPVKKGQLIAEFQQLQSAAQAASGPSPSAPGLPGLPGITEEKVQHTMQKYGITREELMRRLNAQ